MEKLFLQNEWGYKDGFEHQRRRNKGSLHSKHTHNYVTPSLHLCSTYIQAKVSDKDMGMVSCSFVYICCVMILVSSFLVLQATPISPFIVYNEDRVAKKKKTLHPAKHILFLTSLLLKKITSRHKRKFPCISLLRMPFLYYNHFLLEIHLE